MWNNTEHYFGNIKAGTTLEYTFIHNKSKIIRGINPSCSCLKVYPKDNTIRVVWNTPNKIKESYDSYKYLYITYQGDEVEILELKATLA